MSELFLNIITALKKRGGGDFNSWIRKNPQFLAINDDQYLIDNKDIINYYIRYENLEEDIYFIESQFPELKGLCNEFVKIKAKSGVRPKEATAKNIFEKNHEAKKVVDFFCGYEISKFGYKL